jgi:hypothetical protein
VACEDCTAAELVRWSEEGLADDGVSPLFGPDSLMGNACMATLAVLADLEDVVMWVEHGRLDEEVCKVLSFSVPSVASSRTRRDILRRLHSKACLMIMS